MQVVSQFLSHPDLQGQTKQNKTRKKQTRNTTPVDSNWKEECKHYLLSRLLLRGEDLQKEVAAAFVLLYALGLGFDGRIFWGFLGQARYLTTILARPPQTVPHLARLDSQPGEGAVGLVTSLSKFLHKERKGE